MRTTLTLDDDVFRLIETEAQLSRRPMKQIVNEAIRKALTPGLAKAKSRRVRILTPDGGPRSGVDPGSLNRLIDELEEGIARSRTKR